MEAMFSLTSFALISCIVVEDTCVCIQNGLYSLNRIRVSYLMFKIAAMTCFPVCHSRVFGPGAVPMSPVLHREWLYLVCLQPGDVAMVGCRYGEADCDADGAESQAHCHQAAGAPDGSSQIVSLKRIFSSLLYDEAQPGTFGASQIRSI